MLMPWLSNPNASVLPITEEEPAVYTMHISSQITVNVYVVRPTVPSTEAEYYADEPEE